MEKIAEEDLELQVVGLLAAMERDLPMPTELEVGLAIRAVATTLQLPAPTGTALRAYGRILGELPLSVLQASTELLIKEYVFPTFPKPAEWVTRIKDNLKEIETARFIVKIYLGRLRLARMWYGRQVKTQRRVLAQGEFDLPA